MAKNSRAFSPSAWYELLSSMRFAVSLLTLLAIAAVIGTVLKQGQAFSDYVFEFGPFWFKVFDTLGLFDVYHAGWFIAILLFLLVSTGLCLYRNTPLMLKEMRAFREHATEASLRGFAHRAEWRLQGDAAPFMERAAAYLAAQGFRFRRAPHGENHMLAARSGAYRRLGYVCTHAALVIICLGGLLDSSLILKASELLGTRKAETRDIPVSQVPAQSVLPAGNLSFRASVNIPEGQTADVAFIAAGEGYYVQQLPFAIRLKKFHIEHYPTGQPKSFVSDIEIVDKATGQARPYSIAVNHPLVYQGVAIYQANFDDGGSRLTFNGWNLFSPQAAPFPFHGVVKQDARLSNGEAAYTVEFNDFRVFNIEDLGDGKEAPRNLGDTLRAAMRVAQVPSARKSVRNVGPSVRFTVRDSQGQATEYQNYMQPLPLEGRLFFLSGVRASPAEPFHYLRFPADEKGALDGYMNLRAVLFDTSAYAEIARRFSARALQGERVDPALRARFTDSTEKVLRLFAAGGYDAMARFIEKAVPQAGRDQAVQTYLRVLEGAAFEAYRLSRQRAGLPDVAPTDASLQFVRDSLNAVSDSFFYGFPVYFQLASYEQVQASGLQLTRSPGRNVVYFGALLLTAGVFLLFYIRERRAWLLVKPATGDVLFAFSGNRRTLDFEHEFARHRDALAALVKETSCN